MRELQLQGNCIEGLVEEALVGLPALDTLLLYGNPALSADASTFEPLPSLITQPHQFVLIWNFF